MVPPVLPAVVTLVVVASTLAVTWLLCRDSLEPDWQPQITEPFITATTNEDGTGTALLHFLNVGRGSARRAAPSLPPKGP